MSTDPWAFQRWAFAQKTGSPARKGLLSALAMMADATTGRCEAKQETLAQHVEVSERSVREHLSALVKDGLIAQRHQYRRDGTRRGSEFLLLAPWITEWPDGEPITGEKASGQEELPATERADNRRPAAAQEQPPENDHSQREDPLPPSPASESGSTERLDVLEVWAHYQATFPKGASQRSLDPTRRRVIERALKVRSVETVLRAITGLSRSKHHRDGAWTDIRYALKGKPREGESDEGRIDMMAAKAGGPSRAPMRKKSDPWADGQL